MAQVVGKVVSASLETNVKKNGGGTYVGWELVYRTPEGEVRTIAKPVTSLAYNAALKSALASLAPNDDFVLEQEKNQAGFYDVKSISKGAGAPLAQAIPTGAKQTAPQISNYETRDERNARQRLIVRQSSLAVAKDIVSVGAKTVSPETVKELAEDLTNWVFEKGQVGIANIESDIPE